MNFFFSVVSARVLVAALVPDAVLRLLAVAAVAPGLGHVPGLGRVPVRAVVIAEARTRSLALSEDL